jgi:phosphate acetyltransferase
MATRPHFQKLVERIRMWPPLVAAVVYPCDRESLQMAMSGAFAGYLAPLLVGPETRIRDVAGKAGLDISRLSIEDTADEPRAAGIRAAELARDGKVAALVKGGLGNEDLLGPVAVPDSGLRTDRRLSHAFFLDLPDMPRGLLLADAQLNVAPNLAAKRDIVQNTILLANALGMAVPKVALLAAMDGPAPAFPSTTDAVALKAMAAQGMFGSAILDGPLTPDTALAGGAARGYGATSGEAGNADVLIVPSMESGLMMLRTIMALRPGLAAGLVLGAKVPIVIPGRNDSMEVRMASCVLASVMAAGAPAAGRKPPAGSDIAQETGARAAA